MAGFGCPPRITDNIARETADARRLRIASTPAFFIGAVQPDGRVKATRSLRGAVPFVEMQKALDAELGEGLFRLFFIGHSARLAGAGVVAIGFTVLALWLRRRRARTVSGVSSS